MRLNALKFGVACGVVWTLGVVSIAIAQNFGIWHKIYELLIDCYIGFEATSVLGYLRGLVWSFSDAFIGGSLLAYIYNKLITIG